MGFNKVIIKYLIVIATFKSHLTSVPLNEKSTYSLGIDLNDMRSCKKLKQTSSSSLNNDNNNHGDDVDV